MSSDGVILQHRTKLIAHLFVDRSDNLLIAHDTGFFKNSETRYRSFCVLNIALGSAPIAPQASRKTCSFLSVNSFIMYLPGVRTPFRSFLLIRTLSRLLAVSLPGTSLSVSFTLRP